MDQHPRFELVTTRSGEISIRNRVVNEIMHNPVGPWAEANALYIGPSRLAGLLSGEGGRGEGRGGGPGRAPDSAGDPLNDPEQGRPLVLYDVGLGAAANAVAAISCARRCRSSRPASRPLRIISFENDLSLMEFVTGCCGAIPYTSGFADAFRQLLDEGYWQDDQAGIDWTLVAGDFLETITSALPPADLVFYDPYSPVVNGEMWSATAFRRLYERCRHEGDGTLVLTYSRATHVRTAMIEAGFYIGRGPRTGLKDETSQCATVAGRLDDPLDERWLIRWLRSHTRFPPGVGREHQDAVTDRVLRHPQFFGFYRQALLGWQSADDGTYPLLT